MDLSAALVRHVPLSEQQDVPATSSSTSEESTFAADTPRDRLALSRAAAARCAARVSSRLTLVAAVASETAIHWTRKSSERRTVTNVVALARPP